MRKSAKKLHDAEEETEAVEIIELTEPEDATRKEKNRNILTKAKAKKQYAQHFPTQHNKKKPTRTS
jgi:hypothetical protein